LLGPVDAAAMARVDAALRAVQALCPRPLRVLVWHQVTRGAQARWAIPGRAAAFSAEVCAVSISAPRPAHGCRGETATDFSCSAPGRGRGDGCRPVADRLHPVPGGA